MVFKGDLLGFTINGVHSTEFGITRTVEGSRSESDLLPEITNSTIGVPGKNGLYYLGTSYGVKTIEIPFAFDCLSELDLKQIRRLVPQDQLVWLTLDEAPYKSYLVSLESAPNISTVMLGTYTELVNINYGSHLLIEHYGAIVQPKTKFYAGEGVFTFTCYEGVAHNRYSNGVSKKYLNYFLNGDQPKLIPEWETNGQVDLSLVNYSEWQSEAELIYEGSTSIAGYTLDTLTKVGTSYGIFCYNPGDLTSPFELQIKPDSATTSELNITISNGESSIAIEHLVLKSGDAGFIINSKLHLIEGIDTNGNKTGTLYNKYISQGDFFNIPKGSSNLIASWNGWSLGNSRNIQIKYDYYYY